MKEGRLAAEKARNGGALKQKKKTTKATRRSNQEEWERDTHQSPTGVDAAMKALEQNRFMSDEDKVLLRRARAKGVGQAVVSAQPAAGSHLHLRHDPSVLCRVPSGGRARRQEVG